MILLFDYFNTASQDLHYSLKVAGLQGPTVVINDDGFLPEGVTSAYSYYCQMETDQGKPLYFNQVKVPPFWEITGTNGEGEIWEYSEKRAKIFYAEPKHFRFVKNVDWMDKNEKVRFTDHYNQYGWLYARTYFTADQKVTTRSYFSQDGLEVIVENFMTGDVILNWQGKTNFFENRVAFFKHYFREMGWDLSQIWYNSLSTPFFLSYNMPQPGQDVLFWQENIGDDIPGNMKILLASSTQRTQKVVVQDKAVFEKMQTLLPADQAEKLVYLGYIYPEKRANQSRQEIFIFTNTDQIEQLDYLTSALPNFKFHIAALTEMSQHLMAFDTKDNVQLYPNISQRALERLYDTCDIYLDINHGSQVMDVVRKAFEQNMVIFAFENTVHNASLILKDHIVPQTEPEKLVELLNVNAGRLTDKVIEQRIHTSNEFVENYVAIIG
ncbi:TPA: accessory Sec system glycosylation chaperone GtfB [Streptococcus suis]|nr:accessory Sec system glycosylation chaperone GtfB [Streptococcus suis]HEM2548496.1 accessory Sec system glycosylation chaperone GtfB [Streptococcus suis]